MCRTTGCLWVILLATRGLTAAEYEFVVLGDLRGTDESGKKSSSAYGVSGDGQAVVGESLSSVGLGVTRGRKLSCGCGRRACGDSMRCHRTTPPISARRSTSRTKDGLLWARAILPRESRLFAGRVTEESWSGSDASTTRGKYGVGRAADGR